MTLQEQLGALRDGDKVRVEFDNGDACEGRVVVGTDGRMYLHDTSLDSPHITRLSILCPRLRKGDRVRHKPTGRVAFFDHMVSDDDALLFEFEDHTYPKTWHITDCERLPAEPAPQPTVEAPKPGEWSRSIVDGEPFVVVKVTPDDYNNYRLVVRDWTSKHTRSGVAVSAGGWQRSRLDGPPEPPVGAVVALRRDGGEWRIAHRYRDHEPSWCIDGLPGSWYWRGMFDDADASTLRVLAVLDEA